MRHAAKPISTPVSNSLLAALPQREYQRLFTGFEPVTLTFGQLYEPEQPIRHVYFPSDSLVSLLTHGLQSPRRKSR